MQRGAVMLQELELEALLITRGEQGMTLLRHGMPAVHLPARAREVFDVTGCWRYSDFNHGGCFSGGVKACRRR